MNNEDVVKRVEVKVKATLKALPRMVGNEAVNFFRNSFKLQGWLGNSFQAWPKRKTKSNWGKTPRNKGRAILIDTGKLRRGIRLVNADWNSVRIANDFTYAKAHNEGVRLGIIQTVRSYKRNQYTKQKVGKGIYSIKTRKERMKSIKVVSGTITVRQHKRRINQRIPRRQFMGNSPYLNRNIHRLIASELNKALKS